MIIKSSTSRRNDYGMISNLAHEAQEPTYTLGHSRQRLEEIARVHMELVGPLSDLEEAAGLNHLAKNHPRWFS